MSVHTMRFWRSTAGLVVLGAASAVAQSGVINPVSVSTNDPVVFGDLEFLIDGLINVDQNAGIGGSVSGAFSGPYTVSFGLGAGFDLTGVRLWNNAGTIENDGEGIDAFSLLFRSEAGDLLGAVSGNATDTLGVQAFGFDVSGVWSVDLVIESNHAPSERNYAALYEIAFVPSPSAAALIGLSVLWPGTRRRA